MRVRSIAVLGCIFLIGILAVGQLDGGFQPAKIVSFEKLANSMQHPENNDRYKMAMRLGDTLYLCQASGPVKDYMDWTINKELPARVDGKVMHVKNFDGQILQLTITGKKKPK